MSILNHVQAVVHAAVTVTPPAMDNGDFSGLTDPHAGPTFGNPVPIFVPIAWASDPSLVPAGCVPGAAPGQQFPGNKIPGSCISKVSQSLLGFVPKPTNSQELSNYSPNFVPVITWSNWIITGDH